MENEEWEKKKKELLEKQAATKLRNSSCAKLLRRSYINDHGKEIIDYEPWPVENNVLQRIADFMPHPPYITPTKVMRKLNGGDKITTRYGAVYSLISNH